MARTTGTRPDNLALASRMVDRPTGEPAAREVVQSVYLTGSRSTPVHRPDSDWDLTFVLAPGCDDHQVLTACVAVSAELDALRASGQFPGEFAVPKIASFPVVRRCLAWDAASFGELFWQHGVLIAGPELRSRPLTGWLPAQRRPIVRCGIARSVVLLCHVLWRHQRDDHDGGEVELPFSHLSRILRTLSYYHDGTYPIEVDAYAPIPIGLGVLDAADPIVSAVVSATTSARLRLSLPDWGRLIDAVLAVAGIYDEPLPWSFPSRGGCPTTARSRGKLIGAQRNQRQRW
jgi:hypothetical protein